ncbi:hypothetical protein CDO28_21690 (plasmid) [Sinorhizobium meliloti]|nr:hypothetical protein CDO28_21690 [Sinorhizobium meliloti]
MGRAPVLQSCILHRSLGKSGTKLSSASLLHAQPHTVAAIRSLPSQTLSFGERRLFRAASIEGKIELPAEV